MHTAQRPILETDRLLLRPFSLEDAAEVQRLAGEREIAATTLHIPHPYPEGVAEQWISSHEEKFQKGEWVNFAIERLSDQALVGAIGLALEVDHRRAELGYWIGKPYWGQGYCTEAALAVLRYGFETLELNRINANHFGSNPASGRVMQKIGMKYEGTRRQHYLKWGVFEDSEMYAILRSDYKIESHL